MHAEIRICSNSPAAIDRLTMSTSPCKILVLFVFEERFSSAITVTERVLVSVSDLDLDSRLECRRFKVSCSIRFLGFGGFGNLASTSGSV